LFEAASCEDLLERALHELSRYYRHSSAGRRVSGIVHLMNGPLQVLSMQLELLEQKSREELRHLKECPAGPAGELARLLEYRQGKIHHFRQELEKLQALIRHLQHQATHEDREDRVSLDLNQVIQHELELYQAESFFKHQVSKRVNLDAGLSLIEGCYLDFSQSFRNLIDNALEAMADASRRELSVETGMENGWRVVRIGDTGAGIAPEVLPRIFDPFFTTRGTPQKPRAGLGLFMARRLLAPYGGEIRVTSRPGETWASVRLPV
jgi:signal transduction histidine kinase